ncbi:MAG: DUF4389 domain-containing protein [Gammaproteobacteria bacterium]|nr:DUF4389 domain-containing protein [Gammaproteobacteria bacterium]
MPEQFEDKSTWQRILFVALFWLIFHVVQFVLLAVAVGQCLFKLFTGSSNSQLAQLGHNLSQFVQEILQYVTFNSDRRPFPFNDFPKDGVVIEGEKTST